MNKRFLETYNEHFSLSVMGEHKQNGVNQKFKFEKPLLLLLS